MSARNGNGPIYGVELIDELPIDGCTQAMPGADELRVVAKKNQRVVAGYEVLLAHYRAAMKRIEELESNTSLAAPQLLAACKRQLANIERWLETGIPADAEESKSIYEELKAAVKAAEGGE